jgi:glycosyltransferase involved in cell wall biosynthesis
MLSISVVIETVNQESSPIRGLDAVLEALDAQTHPAAAIEILVVVRAANRELARHVADKSPRARIVTVAEPTYFSMKTAGARAASGDVIAFLDSDCLPSEVWAERIAARIERGADVVAGKTRYRERARFARTMNFFNFGYVQMDGRGRANAFLPNNVAFRREVFLEHPFDPRIRRGGAGHLLGNELKSLGYVLEYEPEQFAEHNFYGLGDELMMRVKSGYDSVNLAALDADGVIDETRYLRARALGVIAVFLRRVTFDVRTALANRRDLNLSLLQVPYFVAVSPLVRGIEMAAAMITLRRPRYFKDKYDW